MTEVNEPKEDVVDVQTKPSPSPRSDGTRAAGTAVAPGEADTATEEPSETREAQASTIGADGVPEHVPQHVARRRLVLISFVVLTTAAAVWGTWLAVQVVGHTERDDLRASAAAFARTQALSLMTIDRDVIDSRLNELSENSTGDFRRQLEGMRKTFEEIVRRGEVKSTGKIDSSAISRSGPESARVMLALNAELTNAQSKKPELRFYRIVVDLERKEDRWLVAGMQFVP